MSIAYLYRDMIPTSAKVLRAKIEANIDLFPSSVQTVSSFGYIEFPTALNADEKALLDDYLSSQLGIFVKTDATPWPKVVLFGESPDGKVWKQRFLDLGVIDTEEVV